MNSWRRDLSWLGFGPLAPATWVSPHPLLSRVADIGAALPNARLEELLEMQASDTAADRSIAERCWDLAALNDEYTDFIREARLQLPAFRSHLHDPADAFRARIEPVHAYRHFPTRDPGLPAALQPPGWMGEHARTLFLEAHRCRPRQPRADLRERGRRRRTGRRQYRRRSAVVGLEAGLDPLCVEELVEPFARPFSVSRSRSWADLAAM